MTTSEETVESGIDRSQVRPRQLPQYIAALSVALGMASAGLVLGWTSPAGEDGANLRYSFVIDSEEFSWVSSIFAIGATLACIPIGLLNDLIGRRRTMLSLTFAFTIGWACVIWPNSVAILIVGRFILGASAGAFFVIAPIYIGEISDSETRGRLGSYVQLLVYAGILGSYVLGLLDSMYTQSLISAAVPIIFFAIFFFMPETPTYYLMKGNVEAARKTLISLRGTEYDVESELEEKREGLIECNKSSFFVAIGSRAAKKGLLIAGGLMFFQSSSGVDAIIFYVSHIFTEATGNDGNLSAVCVGTIQVVAVFLFSFVIDKWGRRSLLLISGSVMCLSALVLGVYFYFYENDTSSMDELAWVPLVSISCFVFFYCFGYSPIPWTMIGELFSPQIKAVAASSASMACWLIAFTIIKFYSAEKDEIGPHGIFCIYSATNAVGILFVYFAVPETKNKTLEQIQIELSGKVDSVESVNTDCTQL